MIIFLNIIVFAITIFFQSSFLGRFSFFGFTPDVVLILVAAIAVYKRNYEAYAFAFFTGLILDSLFGGPYGLHTGIFMLSVFIGTILSNTERPEISRLSATVFVSAMTLIFYSLLDLYVIFKTKNFFLSNLTFPLGQVALTAALAFFLFTLFGKMFVWENKLEKVKKS